MSALLLLATPLLADASEVVRFKWLSAPEPWVSFLFALAVVAFALLVYRRERTPAGFGPRAFLAGLRALAMLLVFVLLGELVETTTREEVRPSYVVVMIDDSVSMTLKDRFADRSMVRGLADATGIEEGSVEDRSRLDLVKRALGRDDAALLKALSAKNRLKVVSFGARPLPIAEIGTSGDAEAQAAPAAAGDAKGAGAAASGRSEAARAQERIEALEATSPETAIGDCLNKVVNETRGQHVAGIVLVTDGRSNSGALAPLKVARRLKSRGIPLYTVGVGNPDEPKDISVFDLQAREVVIAGDILSVKASVKSQGFEGDEGRVDVVVRLDDEVVKSEPLELAGKGARQDVAVRIRPEKSGDYTLSIEIAPRPGELIQDNNRLTQRLRVIDKKIKVLYVEALPRYEFRFLRWGLIRDKNMEAHTFLLSADPEFVQDCSPGLSPLSDVPATREELFQYHVVILGDVDPQDPKLGPERIKLLKEFVEDFGGGLLVIAGRNFMPRAYAGGPLESLFPVVIDAGEDEIGGARAITEDFRPKLTLDGRKHPILQLENDPKQNLDLWESKGEYAQGLPGFFWFYRPKERKRTAEVLAVHPDAQTQKQEPVPIFSIQAAGAGTTFFSATDDVWRWRAGVGDRYAYRMWGQAIRFLSTGRLLKSKRFSISTDKAVYDLGDRIVVSAEVNDRNMKPATEETQTVHVEGPDGVVEKMELTKPPQAQGRYEGTRAAAKIGAYKVWISAGEGAEKPDAADELASRAFQVQVPVLEKADPKMDEELLKKMAASTGGKHVRLADVAGLPASIGTIREVTEVRVSERDLWDRWWVPLALVGLLALEWLLRKRWKML